MESTENQITQKYLKQVLHYDKDTGVFTWKVSNSNRVKAGNQTGHKKQAEGYTRIAINTKLYYSHRLAWLYEYGEFPIDQIDHVNHDRADNRIANLREVNNYLNSRNISKRKTNTSGFNGVSWNKRDKTWLAEIIVNGNKIFLGYFKDKNEAICARLHANRLYQFHANHGKDIINKDNK